MANGLLRATIVSVGVEYNGDPNDADIREDLARIDRDIEDAEAKVSQLQQAADAGDASKKGPLTKARTKLAELQQERKKKEPEKDNTIVASLHYPRSGTSAVLAAKPADLPSGRYLNLSGTPGFLDSGLLKEVVHGETIFSISITDRDKKSPFWVFIRKVLGAIFSTVTKGAIGGISEVVVSSTASEVAGGIKGALVGTDKDRVETVAKSKEVKIGIGAQGVDILNQGPGISYQNGVLTLDLVTPKEFSLGNEVKNEGGEVKVVEKKIAKGTPNGRISLRLSLEPVP